MIDMDQNATTPLDPKVLEAMRPYWLRGGNAESRHGLGRHARRAWDDARETVGAILNAPADAVIFTSGGTEANQLAIRGLALREGRRDRSGGLGWVASTMLEHPAVSGALGHLETLGYGRRTIPVTPLGVADTDALVGWWDEISAGQDGASVTLATLMLAQNETGVLQPAGLWAAIAASRGAAFHTDAVQAVGRIPVDFRALGATTLAFSAHKFHGPAGIGALLVRPGVTLAPLWRGGGQQRGLRPGTPPTALAVGLAAALQQWNDAREERLSRWRGQRAQFENLLRMSLGTDFAVIRNGPDAPSENLPQTLSLSFPDRDGDALLMALDLRGIAASLGAACASGSTTASLTLQAMGLPVALARATVRISFGAFTTDEEIADAAHRLADVVRTSGRPESDDHDGAERFVR